ncbi:MAG: carbohydrate-binding family 9-like protein [Candidatus Omnitrophica bacterium]|nr:carbohydrate-binding family 9-like protein [Candidatus Omnitrophota bacterium]
MNRTLRTLLIGLAAFFLASELYAENRTYPCYRLAKTPLIDGEVTGDGAWDNIPSATGFFALRSNYVVAKKQTSFKMMHDGEAIYIGIHCVEPNVDLLVTKAQDNDVNIWQDDSVEIFIFPQGAKKYIQFMISAAGKRWNGIGEPGSQPIALSNWQAATVRGQDYWEVEIKIPFSVLGKKPADGEKWTGNVCRNVMTPGSMAGDEHGDRFSSWAGMEYGFHEPERFAAFVFYNKPLPAGETQNIERQLTAQVTGLITDEIKQKALPLKEKIDRILLSLFNLKTIGEELEESEDLKKEVNLILSEGEAIKKEYEATGDSSLSEISALRELLDKSLILLKRLDGIKYNLLLERLFSSTDQR